MLSVLSKYCINWDNIVSTEISSTVRMKQKTKFKRRSSYALNLMQMSLNKGFCSFTLGLAHEKSEV